MRLAAIAWRGLRARPLRSALAMVGIGLGVAVVTATLVVASASAQALEGASLDLLGRADIRLRAFADAGFGPRTVQSLRALTGVVAAAPVSERPITVSTAPGPNERVFTVSVVGIDPSDDAALREPSLTAGVPLTASDPGGVLVTATWASDNGLGLGDTLLLSGRRPGLPGLTIVGLMSDAGFGALEQGNVIVAQRETLDEAFEVPSPIRYIDVDLGDTPAAADIDRVTSSLSEPFVVEKPADVVQRFAVARDAFLGVAVLFGLVALVVGAFLVGNTLAMTVGERTRELGLLRAAGTTSRQVLGLVLRQALILGIGGSLFGVILGIALAWAMTGLLASTRAVLLAGLPLPVGGILVAFGLGLVVTLIGAALPARRAAGLSPLAALRPSRRPEHGLADRFRPLVGIELLAVVIGIVLLIITQPSAPLLPVALSLGLLVGGAVAAAWVLEPLGRVIGRPFEWFFGAQGMLGRVNLSRDRVRTGLTVGAMMIALASVVALGTIAESARATTDRNVASILPGGHAIRTALPVNADELRPAFEATPGVQVVSPILDAPVVRITETGQEEASVAGIDPSVFEDAGSLLITGAPPADAFAALRNGGAVLVPRSLADRVAIEVGDVISLALPGGAPTELVVAGLLEYSIPGRTPDGAMLVSAADARAAFGAETASVWILVPQPGVASSAFAASVRATAMQMAAQPLTPRELAAETAGTLDRLAGLFDALALVAVVIGALGIVNTLGVGIGERVREIAILRSHGMTVGQVQAMVVAEAAIMGAIAAVLAVATGLVVALALVSGGAAPELGGAVHLPWPLLLAVLLAGTGIAALAGLYPARVAASLPIVSNLKHFE